MPSDPSRFNAADHLAAVAEFEKELISERTAAGLEKARAEGKRIGRPKRRPLEQHRRRAEVSDLVLAGALTKAEGARRLRVATRRS